MKKKLFTAIGLMTGTSMDGLDLSVIKSDGISEVHIIFNKYYEFDKDLRKKLLNLRNNISSSSDLEKNKDELDLVEKHLTLYCGQVVNEILKNFNNKVDLVGFHGQTIYHDSKQKISKQLGNGNLLSQLTSKIVINNFRQEDLNNGGQGAPLIPIYHGVISKILNKKYNLPYPINILNIGGITNLTQVKNDNSPEQSLNAYDIGPGNCLIDEWVRRNSNKKFDERGEFAKSGKVNELIFNQALDNFNIDSYNDSLDVKNFDISFAKGLSFEDGCATLTKFSAYMIAKALENLNILNNIKPSQNIVSGGGRKNNFLISSINFFLNQKNALIKNIDNYEFDGDFIESQGFGYLAIRSFLRLPLSFPNTTRCKKPSLGGNLNKNF